MTERIPHLLLLSLILSITCISSGIYGAVPFTPFDEPSVMNQPYTQIVNDPLFGDYEGTYVTGELASPVQAMAKVVAMGNRQYRIVLRARPQDPQDWPLQLSLNGRLEGDRILISGEAVGNEWDGEITMEGLRGSQRGYGGLFKMQRIIRHSSTEGLAPPAGALVLASFEPGKAPDLSQWKDAGWVAESDGTIHRGPGDLARPDVPRRDLYGKRELRSYKLHLEFRLPYEPTLRDQARGNSGVFLGNNYEIQILDNYGMIPTRVGCAALYSVTPPRINAAFPPLSWQTYDITYHAPKLGTDGKLIRKPRVTVVWNGITVLEDQETDAPTEDRTRPNSESGVLRIQDHGNLVLFRNIWLVELTEEQGGSTND